jgi:hypothetical protein
MDSSPLVPVLLAVGVVAVSLIGFLVLVGLVAAVWFLRGRRVDPEARPNALRELGYAPVGEGRWSRKLEGSALEFRDGATWRWSIRLPRYNTLTLQIRERSAVNLAEVSGAFLADNEVLDQRFVFSSERAAQTLPLVQSRRVGSALLALPNLAFTLHGDELVIEDPGRQGWKKAVGPSPSPAAALKAELDIHRSVAELVSSLFRTMYSATSGTIMPELR